MPYIQRNKQGRIIAVFEEASENAKEELPVSHPDVIAFLFGSIEDSEGKLGSEYLKTLYDLSRSDLAFVRVLEDVIYLLLEKNILTITDFPEEAILRLKEREKIREKLHEIGRRFFSSSQDLEK